MTLVFYEAPHRLVETLRDMLDVLGPRPVAIGRELTKLYEEIWRGMLDAAIAAFGATPPRGEITIVVGGTLLEQAEAWDEGRVRAALHERLARGETRSAAARATARESGWSRRDVYDLAES
jgi:16S rRNA (cytidine1402-2'-O)-methyltransferase